MASPCDQIRDFYAQFANQGVTLVDTTGPFGGKTQVHTIPSTNRFPHIVRCDKGINTFGSFVLTLPRGVPEGQSPVLKQNVFYARNMTSVDKQGISEVEARFATVKVQFPIPPKN